MDSIFPEKAIARFWSNTAVRGENDCWLYKAHRSDRYGRISFDKTTIGAHRFSWMLHNHSVIPPGMFVCHTCDVGLCVNPAHLWLGDNAANRADSVAKGRHVHGDRHWAHLHPEKLKRGDNHPSKRDSSYLLRGDAHPARRNPSYLLRGDAHPLRKNPALAARGDRNGARLHPERVPRGEMHKKAKLQAQDVRAIREAYENGETMPAIARRYHVTKGAIRMIIRRVNWAHVT